MKKRMLAMLLAAVMVVMSLPVFALPAAAIGSGWTFYDTPGTYGYIRTREWTGESFLYYPLNSSSDFDTAFANVEYYQTSYDIVLLADYTANNFVLDAKALNIHLNGHTLTVTGDVEVDVFDGREAAYKIIFAIYGDGGNISFPNNTSTSAFSVAWDFESSLRAPSPAIVKVQDVTFSSCKGRVFNAGSGDWLELNLSNARFENCFADKGSCVYVNGDEIDVYTNGCQFVNCSATDGGAVYVDDISVTGLIEFSNTYAVNCHASGDGGFLYINDADAKVYGYGTTVIAGCSAGDDGGAIYTPKASLIDGFLLSDNRAEDDGGAIFNESTWAAISTISNCRFYRNSCGGDGGALYNDDDNGTIKDCKFFENNCSGDGYELYSNDDDTLLTNCTFTSGYSAESAVDGVTPSNCTFPDKSSYSLSVGDGSQGNPYVINNIDDWDAFHYMVLNHAYMEDSSGSRMEVGTDAFKGKYVRLDADIPVCNTIGESGKVLSYTAKYEFTGTFDGNGHTVTYVTYDMNSDEKAAFGYANGATVKNLTVNGFVAGSWGIGGIFGHAENCTAENCVNNAEIYNNAPYTGGVAGYSIHTSFINCTNNGKITGLQEQVGGIAGYAEQDTFNGCVNNGTVYTGYQKCGGIAGYATNGNFNRCTNNAGVTAAYNYAGGVVGQLEGRTAVLKNCINRGTVTGTQYVGGFVGAIKNTTSLSLFNSVNDAAVNGKSNVSATVSVFPDHSSVANCYFNSDLCGTATYAVPFSSDVMHGISADEYGRSMPHTLNYGVDHDFQANGWLHAAFNDNGLLEFVPDGAAFYMGTDGLIHATDAATRVTGSMETLGVEGESHAYYVDGTVTTTGRVQILGDVTLVLYDDCNYYVQGGIGLEKGNSLTVYSYSLGEHMGSLTAAANQKGAAAIGGNATNEWAEIDEFNNHPLHVYSEKHDCGDLTICGGNIEAVAYSSGNAYGVGIGGSSLSLLHSYSKVVISITTPIIHESDEKSYCGGDGGNVAVYNGNLTVKASGAVGIGGGNGTKYYATLSNDKVPINETYSGGTGGTFAYYGGTVAVESNVAAFGKGRNGGGNRDDVSSSDMTTFTFTDNEAYGVAVGDSLENLKEVYAFNEAPNLNGETCIKIDDWRQTNIEALDPTCEVAGHKAYVLRTADNLYYEDVVFTKLIGNASALQAWKAEGGKGYIPPLGHDWVYDNEDQHKCTRCEKTESHTMGDDGCTKCNEFYYYDYSAETQSLEKKAIPSGTTLFVDSGGNYVLPGGWYRVHGDVTAAERVTFTGDVHLILENGCTFTANQGIALGDGASLSIYAQSLNADKMGKLTVTNAPTYAAGIGSGYQGGCAGISIYGGVITSTGGDYGAGIGSGEQGHCGDISVYGGVITATGGRHAASIGSGRYGSCDDISIYGGVITSTGSDYVAGIGSGVLGTCGDITIYGGNITATGGCRAAGIGSENQSACGDITIYDGNVTAIGGEEAEGIGTYASGTCGTVTICEYLDVVAGADKDSAKPVAAYNGEKYVQLTEPSGAAKEPTCTESGHTAAYKNPADGMYYEDADFTTAIGYLTQYGAWISEGGKGYIAPLGHDWQYVDVDTHKCSRCDNIEEHADQNDDCVCDKCGGDMIDKIKAEAKAALEAAAGENPSTALTTILNDAKAAVDAAETVADVNTAKENGLTAIDNQLKAEAAQALADAKAAAKTALEAAAGENPSTTVTEYLNQAKELVDAAETIAEVNAIKAEWVAKIADRVEAEAQALALGNAQSAAIQELRDAVSSSVSDELSKILMAACEAVEEATTIEDVTTAKINGLNAIAAQLAKEADARALEAAKIAAKAELAGAAGENLSVDVENLLSEGLDAIDDAESLSDLDNIKAEWLDRIEEQLAKEALAAAKAEALAAFDAAANGNASSDMTAILNDAKAAVNEATTLGAVATAKADGLAAISAYLDALSEAKTTAKTAIAAAAGEHPSAVVQASVDAACGMIDDAETPESVMAIQTAVIPVLAAQIEAEAAQTAKTLADAKDAAKTALEAAIGDKPSDEVLMVYAEALHDVDRAETITAVQEAEEAGFAAIMTELATEAAEKAAAEQQAAAKALEDAKDAAKEALQAMAGENPSDELAAILSNAFDTVDEAETMADVMTAEEAGFAAITAQLQAEAEAAKQAVEDELAQAKRDLATATAALNAANNAIEALDKTVASKEATIAEKQAALDTATEQLNAAQANLETAQANLETAQANIEELEGTVAEKDEALKQAAQDLKDAQDALDEMTANYNETKAALETAQKDLADTTKALDEAKAANEQLQKDLAAANESIAELNNAIKSKDATIAEKQAALDTATEQLNAAKTDLDKAKADLETAKANIEELEGTVSEQDEALAQAAKDLEDAQQTLAQNEQEIKDLQAEIERLKALLDDDPTDPQPAEMLGDANNDGAVNMKDVLLMRKYLAGLDVEYNAENADCNGDGEVNMKDVLMLRKYLANIIDTLGA